MRRGSTLALFVFAAALGSGESAVAHAPNTHIDQVAAGIYVRPGVVEDVSRENDDAIANIGFIVGRDAVAVIDPGGSRGDGERLHAAIRARTSVPIRYVIMTHVHPDHVFGAGAFVADHPVFVGHDRMPAALARRGDFYRQRLVAALGDDAAGNYVVPTMLVAGKAELDLGGRILQLTAHATAHTDDDLTIYDPQTQTLWAGDLLFIGRVPSLDGSLRGWLKELSQLAAIPARRAVPGHGPSAVPWPQGAVAERRYLQTLLTGTRAVIKSGGDIEQAVATVGRDERTKWALFEDYNGGNVTAAFKELEWE